MFTGLSTLRKDEPKKKEPTAQQRALQDYLKRYTDGEDGGTKKKKKKRPKAGAPSAVAIVDNDVTGFEAIPDDTRAAQAQRTDPRDHSEEAEEEQEDAPTIANPEEAEALRLQIEKSKNFYEVGQDGSGWAVADEAQRQRQRRRHDSPGDDDLSPPRRGGSGAAAGARGRKRSLSPARPDLSPPRRSRQRHDSPADASPPRRSRQRHDSPADASPPRRGRQRHDSPADASPPRRGRQRHDSPADASPPRRSRQRHDSPADASPPRRGRHDSPADASPPRRGRQRHDSPADASPPRRGRHDSPADASPPRRGRQRHDSPADASPPRRGRHDSPADASPPRRGRQRHDSPADASPPRRGRQRHDSPADALPPRRGRQRHDSPADASPPRRGRHDSPADASPPRRGRHDSPEAGAAQGVGARMGDGTATGLVTSKQLAEETVRLRAQAEERKRLAAGKGEATVYRDKATGKVISAEEFAEQVAKAKRKKPPPEEIHIAWKSGLAQQRAAAEAAQRVAEESGKAFGRGFDVDADAHLRDRSRWGDPMAGKVRKKGGDGFDLPPPVVNDANREALQGSGFIVPQEVPPTAGLRRGVAAPVNRYNIRPGRHWDGVDRSTGFEKEAFKLLNAKAARELEARQWAQEDM